MAEADAAKLHAIMVQFLFQGHITPFSHLALALASKGCTVTYVQTEFQHYQMKSTAASARHDQLSNEEAVDLFFPGARESGLDIRYTTISDGFPLDFDRDLNFLEFYESILRDFPARVDELVGKIVESDRSLTPFLVADATYLWPPAIANKYNMVQVAFWTSTALHLSLGYHFELLKENGQLLLGGQDMDHIDVPGVRRSNIEDFIKYDTTDEDPQVPIPVYENIMKARREIRKADFILCNTVEELEPEAILGIKQSLQTYAIGPTNFFANFNKVTSVSSLQFETDCTKWLNSKPVGSVLYISFGSLAQADKQLVWEIACGLLIARVNFIWVLSLEALNSSDETSALPPGFMADTEDKGLIIPWCDQRAVLSSTAIGAFLTHCGWNSLLESIWYGVPVICYPFSTDQPFNRNMVVDDWKVGINLCEKGPVSKERVAETINSLMNGTASGNLIKQNMKKTSKIVHDAVEKDGSSTRNLDHFLKDLKTKICTRSKNIG
ncbi:UDP-glycosyltransferase 86A1-like [Sesamum indicum]|uniref:Glycosyltransferase n=1 Tax=Sesamum indicum TaxID=4182 RepID=A0A6I9UBV0_SESIN|nr:UDP-glycosyltransferase 86A1-like [Sesamum indicum]XP_020552782.1 UDP-glycosyltransferase 86A1-like [Sesamum indicum]XP_020552784.1 UDP-glycosyltransferase 86A1-like [Sesamum indicum]